VGQPKKEIHPTFMQKTAVDAILSGKSKTVAGGMRLAGYAEPTIHKSKEDLVKSRGVQEYLKTFSKVSKKRWNLSIQDKVMATYVDGLEATKLVGKDAVEHPDYIARKMFADKFSEFFGWSKAVMPFGGGQVNNNQFNFFSLPEPEREQFNETFKHFLGEYYKGS